MSKFFYSNGLHYTIEQLTDIHNQSFAQYFVPTYMTPEQTATMYRTQHISLSHTHVMHTVDGNLVGLAKVAVRGSRAYCAGFSIVPALRKQGMGKLLLQHMIQSTQLHMASIQLEVLYQNTGAIKLYTQAGFVRQTELIGLQIATSDLLKRGKVASVTPVDLYALLPQLARQPRPVWGREISTLLALNIHAVAFTNSHGSTSALVYSHENNHVVIQAAILSAQTPATDLSLLLCAVARDVPFIYLYNEPVTNRLASVCLKLGFREMFRQYMMKIDFDKK